MVEADRVLVVDDEPMVREVLARYLEQAGFSVSTAEDGEEALASFGAVRPDLVLLDLMLRGSTGSRSSAGCAPVPPLPSSC